MIKIEVNKATNIQLDYLVAKCQGLNDVISLSRLRRFGRPTVGSCNYPESDSYWPYSPSTSFDEMCRIVQDEKINTSYDRYWKFDPTDPDDDGDRWFAELSQPVDYKSFGSYGKTMLIAAARCYVKSELGEIVEIPEELK